MNWFNHISSLSNPVELATIYATHVFGDHVQIIFIDAILILAIHGFYILLLTRMFKHFVADTSLRKSLRASFLSYLIAILLVVVAHCNDIFVLALALDSLKVFPDPLTTFYYVSGMYTTIGSAAVPAPQWQALSMIIAFTGLFAFAISGAGLYSMLGFFLAASKNAKTDS
jgi:hypothetical protein